MLTRNVRTAAAVLGIFACAVGPALAEDTLQDVQKKIIAAAEKVKSLTADMKSETDMVTPQMTMKGQGTGTIEFMRKGDKLFSRVEMTNKMTQKMGETENKMEQSMVSIIDGEYAWSLVEMAGNKNASKTRLDPNAAPVPTKETFERYAKDFDIKLLPDEKVSGRDCFVLELKPKAGNSAATMMGRQVQWYDKETGMPMKIVVDSPEGKPFQTVTFSNVKVNPDLNPDRFVFKAPEGVQVMDMSKGEAPTMP